jgi:two-component system sensor histidine kinase PilS (NtrC family)
MSTAKPIPEATQIVMGIASDSDKPVQGQGPAQVANMQPDLLLIPDSFWRSIEHLNHFRLFLAGFLAIAGMLSEQLLQHQLEHPYLFVIGSLVYFLSAWLFGRPTQRKVADFQRMVGRQAIVDILCLAILMFLAGGNGSGLGLLLMLTLAAVGMLPETRNVLLWAAVAAIVVLGEQSLQALHGQSGAGGFVRSGLLSLGLFGVALLSNLLAKGTLSAGALALEKSRQAESFERINERMIQELPYAVMAVGASGEILQYNAHAEASLGAQFFNGSTLTHCAPQLALLWQQWRRGESVPSHPFQTGVDGHRLRARFMELEPTRKQGAVVVLDDMTELEMQAQKMKLASLGLLTANLAHEIRNPLSAIRHAAGLLKEDAHDALSIKLTRIIDDNAMRLNGLVEDVLSLNRRDRMQRVEIDLGVFMPAFVQAYELREGLPPGVMRVSVTQSAKICFDSGHLEQILWNLIRNAWRYCLRQPGSIRIRLHAEAARVEIEVINDGPGISQEVQAHLFEPFYTTDNQGTGLGLYIARELAEANGALLRYVDIPDGALFRLRCPLPPCQ